MSKKKGLIISSHNYNDTGLMYLHSLHEYLHHEDSKSLIHSFLHTFLDIKIDGNVNQESIATDSQLDGVAAFPLPLRNHNNVY